MELKVKLTDGAPLPRHAKPGDAGLDLTSRENVYIAPFETVLVHTGIAVEIPEGFYGAVVPRSGISTKKGLAPINSPSTIDSGYRGEILVPLHNFSGAAQGIERGERIVQLIIMPYQACDCVSVSELSDSERADSGFGSTGA